MNYLLTGEDTAAKDRKIAEIKSEVLRNDNALKFDYEILHAVKLEPETLKKALTALPAVAKKRLILIRTADKLSTQNKKLILEHIESGASQTVLILDTSEGSGESSFLKKVKPAVKVISCGSREYKKNVFDMTRAMERRDLTGALKILSGLLEDGNHPLQIMGGLVWFWGKAKSNVSHAHFIRGLKILQEADLNIKRSRLKPDYAVELAVTKLGSLLNPN